MKLVFLGPPGAGKGTQADIISEKLDIPHISSGDIFRDNIRMKTDLGFQAKQYLEKGLLVPDNITNNMVQNRLNERDTAGFILDGYPRTLDQARFLEKLVSVDKVFNFEVSEAEIIKRISGRRTCKTCSSVYHIVFKKPKEENICDKCKSELTQRADEKPDIVKSRLKVYIQQTAPLIKFYEEKGILVNIDASVSIESATEKILSILKNFLNK